MKKLTIALALIALCVVPVLGGTDEKGIMVSVKRDNGTDSTYYSHSSIGDADITRAAAKCRTAIEAAIERTKRTRQSSTIIITIEETPRPKPGAMISKVKSLTPEDVLKFKAAQILAPVKVNDLDRTTMAV
jgi:hypothetical protein